MGLLELLASKPNEFLRSLELLFHRVIIFNKLVCLELHPDDYLVLKALVLLEIGDLCLKFFLLLLDDGLKHGALLVHQLSQLGILNGKR